MLVADNPWDVGAKTVLPSRYTHALRRFRKYLRPTLTYKRRMPPELDFIASFPRDATILNIGSGESNLGTNVVNLDIDAFQNVSVVGLAENLPLADSSCDAVVLVAVLEHVRDPARTFSEISRVLRPLGRVFVDVPFLQGYHAAPNDYRRFTEQGLRTELQKHGFELEASGVSVGPASAMAWITSEFLALLISSRSVTAYRLVRLVTSWLAWPLKFGDAWLTDHPMAYSIASGVWATGRLPN
jgi:SAM-dependent methyltransferase